MQRASYIVPPSPPTRDFIPLSPSSFFANNLSFEENRLAFQASYNSRRIGSPIPLTSDAHSLFGQPNHQMKAKGTKGWVPFDPFAESETQESEASEGINVTGGRSRAYSVAAGMEESRRNETSKPSTVNAPGAVQANFSTLNLDDKRTVEEQFDVKEWNKELPVEHDPTVLEILPPEHKRVEINGLKQTTTKPTTTRLYVVPPLPTTTAETKKENKTSSTRKTVAPSTIDPRRLPLGTPFMNHKMTTDPRRQSQEEVLAALGVQPAVQPEQKKKLTQEDVLSNLLTVEDLLKQDKIEAELRAQGHPIGERKIETVQRLAGFPNPLQQLAKSRLAGYAVAKAEEQRKLLAQFQKLQLQNKPSEAFAPSQTSQYNDANAAATMGTYHFGSTGSPHRGGRGTNFSFSLPQQPAPVEHPNNPQHALKMQDSDTGIRGGVSLLPPPEYVVPARSRRTDLGPAFEFAPKPTQYQQPPQPVPAPTTSREVFLRALHKIEPQQEETFQPPFGTPLSRSLAFSGWDQVPESTLPSYTAPLTGPTDAARQTSAKYISNIDLIGASDPLPWKERPVDIHTVQDSDTSKEDVTVGSKKAPPGLQSTAYGRAWVQDIAVSGQGHLATNPRAQAMLDTATKWWTEDKRVGSELRQPLQAVADDSLNQPASGPEGYCANHLLIHLLGSLHDYLVESPNEQRAMFGSFVEVPEWAVDKGTSGLTSFFGEDWGVPPQRVGRDPRYRPLMHDPRFTTQYEEQEYWNRSPEHYTHPRRYR